ncbi:Aconitate hydratase precursor [Chromobacterium violaceum]|uniref:aconitate hydratase n=1 Tax=Chromobacterium violaceum TaxID=536 RepID=A0A3S4HNY2_CHRVL|nr:Aconitate hydratase precursor [Chromobacterium violaceum]
MLAVTERLRQAKVVGKFVEFFGEGAASLTLPDRATLANMAPEYGATMGFFPPDERAADYLAATGRSAEEVDAFRRYFQAQKLFGMPREGDIDYSETLTLDLASVVPSVAGPRRPQDRIALTELKPRFGELLQTPAAAGGYGKAAGGAAAKGLTHGSVLIAAITSCTNTSNPGVMLAAACWRRRPPRAG